ncbi:hypothetical protein CBR_g28913 [Chara braunii]|uniref:Integrase catalytic domain-containing protein n=1 Tax=Chara braunii TaxID=69332 RepID=A0A388LA58_CHABU|nr:hypothetical protein CBR_g28913 [Chara braunii]|eukprot:GBG79197.1 hypothetical protein CBR_g28913 [Chara braunii]
MREQAAVGPCRINEGNEEKFIVGEPNFLLPQARALMIELMRKRHRAYAFNDDQRGRLDVDKIPMFRIHTVPHEPWNLRGARYPNPDEEKKVVDYLDDKIRTHVADYSRKGGGKNEGTFREGGLVLGVPDYDATEVRPFVVEADAGLTALGGVLIQADVEGNERPLRFESRTLNTTERNYSQFKKETLAVLHCLRIFRNYIFGRRFILRVDPTALAYSLRNYVPSDPTVVRWLTYIWMFNFELERIPKNKNKADGLSHIDWDQQKEKTVEAAAPVDGFLDRDEDICLHINEWSLRVPNYVGHPIWLAPRGYEQKAELVLKPFEEEDPWGGKDVQWMMKLALAGTHSLVEEVRTIEEGSDQVMKHQELMGGMYLLVNTLLQGNFDQDDEFEEGEIKEAFRAEEYDGIYLELGLLLSCEMRDRDTRERAQKMRHLYGHLFVKRQVGNPRRVVCGRNHQIDIIATLHDGIAGGHRGVSATYAKISELYYWDEMMEMVSKFCRSCVPCQERSPQRPGEPLHPRLEREVGTVVRLDLLFMPIGDHGYNYIFDARDNLSGFVHGRAIRTKSGSVLISYIEEYYLRYPFVREFVMDRGSEFTCQEVQELLSRSHFTKTAMPRGGRGTRPPRRPLGASGGYERHGSRHREHTPIYDDGDIELFLDDFRGHAEHMGWTVTQMIERLRGASRFEEPIARIRREFMHDQRILRDEWARTLPLWTRKAERPLARQIRDMARDWESYRAHLREAFRRPEPPPPRVERRQRSKRQRDPEPREAMPSRGGRKALARREEGSVPEAEERGAYPECGLGLVVFQRYTGEGLSGSPQRVREEAPPFGRPLQEFEAHLDVSQWRVSPTSERRGDPAEGVPREEVREPQRETRQDVEGGHATEEVIEVEEDTPPQARAAELGPEIVPEIAHDGEEPRLEEIPSPPPEAILSPEVRIEMERERTGWSREPISTIDRYLAAHAQEHPDIEEPVPREPPREPRQAEGKMGAEIPDRADHRTRGRAPAGETAEERRAKAGKRVEEIWEERQRLEAAGALPYQPPDTPPKPCGVKEMWDEFFGQHGEGLETPERAGFGTSRSAIEYLDRKIRFLAKTSFDKYLMLEVEAELRELRALTTSQAATIQEMGQHLRDMAARRDRETPTGVMDWTESRRYDIQGGAAQGLSGQPSMGWTSQEPSTGKVILEPEEAKAKREAEKEAFELRAPTELATQPEISSEPVSEFTAPQAEDRPRTTVSQPALGSDEGSMDALLDVIDTMQEGASVFLRE